MNYDVVVADRAAEELESAARWWAEHRSLNQAERWYDGFIQAILTLDQAPDRYPLARENHKFPLRSGSSFSVSGENARMALYSRFGRIQSLSCLSGI